MPCRDVPPPRARCQRRCARARQGPPGQGDGAGARQEARSWQYIGGPCSVHRREPRRRHKQGHGAASRRPARAHAQERRRTLALAL